MYKHTVQYYETDKMGITHHSNYIRWMEEARIDFLQKIGFSYARLEEMGIVSPVTYVDCQYKKSTTFGDVVDVDVSIEEFKGIRLKLSYIMKLCDGNTVCIAHSEHAFLNTAGMPVRLKKDFPHFYEAIASLSKNDNACKS